MTPRPSSRGARAAAVLAAGALAVLAVALVAASAVLRPPADPLSGGGSSGGHARGEAARAAPGAHAGHAHPAPQVAKSGPDGAAGTRPGGVVRASDHEPAREAGGASTAARENVAATVGGVSARVLRVGPAGDFARISEALDAARAGDTVLVAPGTYRERLRVGRPVVLLGEGRPVVDAGGQGHVVEADAGLEIRGFHLRGSGKGVDAEHAGVMVRGGRAVVVDNVITDVLYGVYLKDAGGSLVRANRIEGKDLPPPRRGDGIRLWYSSGSRILENRVRRARDVVIYFSHHLLVRGNVITDGRYGLHYMYSDHNEFRRNYFARNQVGAFVMYSRDVSLRENVFAESRGASGMGMGLKDADAVVAEDNLFVENQSGVYLDNSPRGEGQVNRFRDNLFLYNGSGVRMLPSVKGNRFEANSFVSNDRPVEVSGGVGPGQTHQNGWRGNYWSGYAGFDRDDDGVGDTPYRHARLADDLLARHPELRLFARSPVMPVIEAVRRFFPFLEPEPVVVDSAPRLAPAALRRWERSPPVRGPADRAGAVSSRGRASAAAGPSGTSPPASGLATGAPDRAAGPGPGVQDRTDGPAARAPGEDRP